MEDYIGAEIVGVGNDYEIYARTMYGSELYNAKFRGPRWIARDPQNKIRAEIGGTSAIKLILGW